ncbi:MAG: hypothetical protein LBP21_11480 [Synergistaceae bacterium]|jgi:hypothetical protein|nr:hypothetical protein [Synergistaceae bacterium]
MAKKKKEEELLNNLTHEMAISILKKLYADKEIRDTLVSLAEAELKKVDAEEIAAEVFYQLNALEVEELWDHSGETRDGYVEPSELGHTMVEDVIEPFLTDIIKYRDLGMKKEEMETCKGLLRGLAKYENEGDNEFQDWIPDSIMDIARDVLNEYGKHNTQKDTASVKQEIDPA